LKFDSDNFGLLCYFKWYEELELAELIGYLSVRYFQILNYIVQFGVITSLSSVVYASCRYEEGVTVLTKVGLASDFIWSEAQTPLEMLGSVTEISFDDPASAPIKNHELTTDEVVK
jgi:hypothetical protein